MPKVPAAKPTKPELPAARAKARKTEERAPTVPCTPPSVAMRPKAPAFGPLEQATQEAYDVIKTYSDRAAYEKDFGYGAPGVGLFEVRDACPAIIPPPPPSPADLKPTNPKDGAAVDKAPLGLVPSIAAIEQSLAQYAGRLKYGQWNWRAAGVLSSVYVHAIHRHLARWVAGEERDAVEDTHHLGNIMACCAILLDAQAAGKLVDDRPPSTVDFDAALVEAQARMAKLHQLYGDRAPRHFTVADTGEILGLEDEPAQESGKRAVGQ